jgi:very-short-patch-repair endonuclease
MMSPLSIAQYLPRGTVEFDLCIVDEASQMPPENAIGALLRANQAMIVGDTNQLPPTSFFRKMIVDEDADEDETVLEESILEMANATFRPARRLRWHYRSRHSSLIRYSNRMVYDDNLIVFPSAAENRSDMGVSLKQVEGAYKGGMNAAEAKIMVEQAIRFMREQPLRSLGVVTLNQKQRDLILEEMEYALSRDSKASEYIEYWASHRDGLESFFIKNLENVQGDERDVIFIGTVYGPEKPGARVHQRFGPINGIAGKRRLNVLFSRAKEQVVTFSSMTAGDILANETGNPGAYMLKCWLEYSATGRLDSGEVTLREPDSDFEEFVAQQIRSMGCEAVHQVGVVGYFIDIGVKHSDWPHGFLLGVECDGATYHSSKSARDRDRLRQEVLEGLGWHFHRIWSTDWFSDPQAEAEKLRQHIEERLAAEKAKGPVLIVPTVDERVEAQHRPTSD